MPEDLPPKGLLALAGEIRNRIYLFAKETDYAPYYTDRTSTGGRLSPAAPLLRRHTDGRSPWPLTSTSARTLHGLTQTCKLLRKEYRPLWLQDSCSRVLPENLNDFLDTFFPLVTSNANYQPTPKLLQVAAAHQTRKLAYTLDLTHVLRLHARNPKFYCELVPHQVIEWATTRTEAGWDWVLPHWLLNDFKSVININTLLMEDNPQWLQELDRPDMISRVTCTGYAGIERHTSSLIFRSRIGWAFCTVQMRFKEAVKDKYQCEYHWGTFKDRAVDILADIQRLFLIPANGSSILDLGACSCKNTPFHGRSHDPERSMYLAESVGWQSSVDDRPWMQLVVELRVENNEQS